jgi:hypothetical protein
MQRAIRRKSLESNGMYGDAIDKITYWEKAKSVAENKKIKMRDY